MIANVLTSLDGKPYYSNNTLGYFQYNNSNSDLVFMKSVPTDWIGSPPLSQDNLV